MKVHNRNSANGITGYLILSLVTLLAGMLPATLWAESEGLTLRQCIDLALKNQPSIRASQEAVNATLGREVQATSPYYPQVTASAGYNESHSVGGAFGDTITKNKTTTLSMNQLLYDFGKTGNSSDVAKWSVKSSKLDAERVRQEIILNVKQSFFALLQARKIAEVAQTTVEQTGRHLSQAQAFFQAGSRPRFDVTRAEVDVNNAKLGSINALNNVRLRTIALNNAMGVDPGRKTDISSTFPPLPALLMPEQALSEALKNRPELQKFEADIESARSSIRAEQANYLPTLSANGAYTWANGTSEMGPYKGDIQNSWNAGIMLTIPLFQGGLTRGRISEARANYNVLEARRDAIRQAILLEVNQAYADIESATARIEVMESTRKKARENLELAQGRYDAGVGPHIEVTDAQLSAVNAETDHIQALYDYQLAVARLLKSMGRGQE